jgi:hypothetical protein
MLTRAVELYIMYIVSCAASEGSKYDVSIVILWTIRLMDNAGILLSHKKSKIECASSCSIMKFILLFDAEGNSCQDMLQTG